MDCWLCMYDELPCIMRMSMMSGVCMMMLCLVEGSRRLVGVEEAVRSSRMLRMLRWTRGSEGTVLSRLSGGGGMR